jgi:hypothetical protein
MKRYGAFALVIYLFGINSFAQNVAEIARKERERQKASRSRVVISSSTGTTTTAPQAAGSSTSDAAAPAATAAAKPAGPTDNQGRDEKFWRAAFQKARDDAKRADERVILLDLKQKDLNTQLLRQSDVYNRENRIGAELTASQNDLDAARKEAEQAKKKITDLEEQLRRSGGPAGWAR